MTESILFVELGIDATNDDLIDQMRVMKRCREQSTYRKVVCVIRGYSEDPRELYQVPEVRAFCKRLVNLGFISYLEVSTLFSPKASDLRGRGWGAAEVWLCSEGRLGENNGLTSDLALELDRVVLNSNARSDGTLGPMAIDELRFDLTAVDQAGFKEDAVREDIIAPVLRKAGYRATGSLRMERSKSLPHPYVMIGSKKHKINIVPDYTLYDGAEPLLVLEAKAPGEQIVQSSHVEQAFSYAIHPDVRCMHYALCNGRSLAFYRVDRSEPLFVIACEEIRGRWAEVEKYLLPRYLKTPELRQFHSDFGLQARQAGVPNDEEIVFQGCYLQLLNKSSESYYVAASTVNLGGLECLCTFDFGEAALRRILEALPVSQADQIRAALARMPYSIDLDAKVQVHWKARLGELSHGPDEDFIPMIVTDLFNIAYDAAGTVGPQDPLAVRARVPRLRVG